MRTQHYIVRNWGKRKQETQVSIEYGGWIEALWPELTHPELIYLN